MLSESLSDRSDKTSESNSFPTKHFNGNVKNLLETMGFAKSRSGDITKHSSEQQTVTTGATSSIGLAGTTKHLMHNRFSVNDILSPLNNMGK
uniref:Uncharacterized protein n=1 Tax=Setaria digitata TaxID=48799 RepID=A0A915Q0B5_9BILA